MRRPGTTLIFAALLVLCIQLIPAASIAQGEEQTPNYLPGQLIIGFQPWVTQDEIDDFYEQYGLVEMDDLNRDPDSKREVKLAFVPVDVDQDLIDSLERDPRVKYAEPNYIVQASKVPDDPDWEKLWGLNNSGQTGGTTDADIDAPEGWDVTSGSSSVLVAVIDTGVDYAHEDLVDNMWINPGECPNPSNCEENGEDDDDNGYVDDIHGINAITDSGDPMDDFGHGTHVAGTIGAAGDNGIGVVGVNWNVAIVACKFLSASGGGSSAGAIKCFNYISHLKNEQGQNIVVVNNSWGGGGASEAMKEAMEGPDQPLHVCAAGNNNSDTPHFPAAFELENIISVAATDDADLYAGFSNYGDTVDLAGPGVGILSTVPTGSCALCDPSGYASIGGTSMATPHVAGAAALIAGKYSSLTPVQIRQRILTGVDPLSDVSKTTVTNGRLNVLNTLEEDEIPPASVGDLAVNELLLTQIGLTWTSTGDDGMNGTATSYDVRYSKTPINPDNWDNATHAEGAPKPQVAGSPEEFTVTGLDPATTYYLGMKVLDNVGNESDLSNVVIGKTSAGTIVFEDDMEDGQGEWTTAGSDDLWHLSEHRSNSPSHAWYYGDESTRNYDTGGATNGFLISPPIDLTTNKDVLLTFYEWSELENSTTYDRTRVQMSVDEGTTWETVFESHGTQDNWMLRTVSLTPYIGDAKTIHIRFWFDSIDNRFNTFEGWYVDDVQVLVAAPGLPGEGPSLPNLFMQDANIGFSVPEPLEGTPVEVSAVVINNGFAEATDVKVQFMDLSGDSPVPLGEPETIANIAVGGSGTAKITYETDGKVGERTLQVVADPFNLITEVNEADNQAQKEMTIVAQPAPNVVVKSSNIGFNPAGAEPGEQVTVSVVVVNDGAVQASNVVVQVVDATDSGVSEPIGDPQIIEIMAPGESSTIEVTYDTSGKSGSRKIKVSADPQNAIAESDEDDNEATATLELASPPLPNLVVSSASLGFDPAQPISGDTVTIVATVMNEGEIEARGVMVQFTDVTNGSTVIGEPQTIQVIAPGASGVAQVTYSTSGRSGDRKIQVNVDPYNFIAESKEFDNEATTALTVTPPPAPDLAMASSNIGFDPTAPIQGEETIVDAVVLNNGNASAVDITVQFLDVSDGAMIPIGEKQTIAFLASGGSSTAEVVYDTSGLTGERSIQVIVDPNNFIAESNETDNEAVGVVTVELPPAPNLAMLASNILFDPAEPTLGDEVTITAAVLNTGEAAASQVLVQVVDVTNGGFQPIGDEQTIELIAAGRSATASVVYDTSGKAGKRKIQVLVDSNNLVAESNETDNEAVTTLTVVASPIANLVVTESSIGFNPLHPVVGDEMKVTASIQNQGDAGADDVLVQLLDVSEGESIPVGEPQQIESIEAGGAVVVEATYLVSGKPGERQLRFVVDPGNFIPESDETDNRATATLLVSTESLPNLVVQSANIGFSSADPVEGDVVTVTVTILNNGDADASDVLVQFVDATGGGAEPIDAKQTLDFIASGTSAAAQIVYDTSDKSGERRIRVVADPHMVIVESSEIDNEAIALLVVQPAPLPNLVITEDNIGFSATDPAPGEIVTVTATILNDGMTDAENVVVQFVDATDNGGTPIGANQMIDSIPSGGSGLAQIAYNTAGRFGDRKIQVVVDPNNLIAESDKNDNRAVGTISVQTPPVANLVMESSAIGFNPSEPKTEDTVEIYATVRNEGTAAASEISVNFLDVTAGGSVPIGEVQTIATIAAGSSGVAQVTYSIPATGGAAAGDRKIQVVVDPNNTVFESDESDNDATATLTLSKATLANLTVLSDNITFSDPAPVQGDTVTVNAVILNTGAADAADVVVQFGDVTDTTLTPIGPPQVIPGIPAGGSATVEIVYDTTGKSGDRSIQVTADPSNFIPESKETDNTSKRTLAVSLPATPNLVVLAGNIGFDPAIPTEGEAVTVNAVVLNHGAKEAHAVVVQFMDVTDGATEPIETPQTVVRIPAGAGVSVQVTYETSGKKGERTLQVTADPNNFIVESDDADNKAIKSLSVAPPPAPNLVALSSNVEFDPATPIDGDLVTIYATVLNDGTAMATDVVVRLTDITDGIPELIGKQRLIDSILPGESGTVQVTYDVTDKQGDRKIQFSVDPNNTIAETDEMDNVALVSLTVAPPPAPNLVVKESNIEFTPVAPVEGAEVTVSVTVHNEGAQDASMVEVAFEDVTNGNGNGTPIGSVQTIATIPSGGSGTVQVTYDTTDKAGDRVIRVTADPNNQIAETDDTDNQAEATLTVLPAEEEEEPGLPNLTVTSGAITFDPSSPVAGDMVTVTVVVTNSGEGAASDVVVRFSDETGDSPEQIGSDQTISSIAAGESGTASVTYDTTEKGGDRTIQVSVDPDDTISESDETDNEATATLSVSASLVEGGRPNLVVRSTDVLVDAIQPQQGDVLTIAAVIHNDGTMDVEGVRVQFRDVSDAELLPIGELQMVDYIPAGGSVRIETLYDTAGKSGPCALEVVIDPEDMIRELDEGDNAAGTSIEVLAISG